jgi:hypothetical protein
MAALLPAVVATLAAVTPLENWKGKSKYMTSKIGKQGEWALLADFYNRRLSQNMAAKVQKFSVFANL